LLDLIFLQRSMQSSACCLFHDDLLLAYTSTLEMKAMCSPKRRLTFTILHDVIDQKKKLFFEILCSSGDDNRN
jgi:hypothetical protein